MAAPAVESPNEKDICDSGYKCQFKDDNIQESFKCSSCMRVSRDPHATCCGPQFCGDYLRRLAESTDCPECGERYESMPCKKTRKQILMLEVFCTMRNQGCHWEGVVKGLGEHEDICDYVYVPCPQNCCQDQITRRSLDTHMKEECPKREYSCPHCNFKDTYTFVTNAHLTECSYKPVACPNHCGVEGERDDMDTHIQNECPLEYIACKLGCSTKYRREDEMQHSKDYVQQHLTYLAGTALQMNDTIKDLKEKIASQKEQFERQLEDIKKQLDNFITQQQQDGRKEDEIEQLKTQLEQETSRLELLEKQVSNMTNNAQQDECLGEDISPPEHSGDSERREIRELERKSDEKDRELRTKLEEHEAKSNKQITQLDSKVAKLEKLLNNLSAPTLPHPQDDHFEFTLKNYRTLKEEGGEWNSQAFPAFEEGPHLQVIAWPNGQGEGKGTHVSVWLAQQEVKADYFLEPHQITLKLELVKKGLCLYPTPPCIVRKDFVVLIPNRKRYIGHFSNKFIPHSALTNEYLVDDSLDFRITCTRVCIPEEPPDDF